MDIEPGDILRDTEPNAVEGLDGRYHLVIPEAWRIFYAFGGATMAAALRAATVALDRPDLRLLSADATFCEAVKCGPIALQVEVLRQGRTGAQALVRLWALDPDDPDPTGPVRNDLVLTCVFGAVHADSFEFLGLEFPDVAHHSECSPREDLDPASPFASIPYHHQTEFLLTDLAFSLSDDVPPREPRAATWFRFKKPPMLPDGTWEPAALALPGDILGTAVHAGVGSSAGHFLVISLQISIQFVAPMRGEWLLQHTHAHVAGDGYSSGTADLWDDRGNLIAIATQCARVRPLPMG